MNLSVRNAFRATDSTQVAVVFVVLNVSDPKLMIHINLTITQCVIEKGPASVLAVNKRASLRVSNSRCRVSKGFPPGALGKQRRSNPMNAGSASLRPTQGRYKMWTHKSQLYHPGTPVSLSSASRKCIKTPTSNSRGYWTGYPPENPVSSGRPVGDV